MNSSVKSTMFCGFCKNKGKNFKSHDLKNNEGIVICKELLAVECGYCHKFGHTKKHCNVLEVKIKNKKEKDEENYNNSFPTLISSKDKKYKQIEMDIKTSYTSYKDVSVIFREKLVLAEIIEVLEKYNIEQEIIKKKKDKEKEDINKFFEQKKQLKIQKKQLKFQKKQLKFQKKKNMMDLFISDMTELLGCNWFLFIKKHFIMEELVKKYNLLLVEDLNDIRREYEYEFEEQMKKHEWEEYIQQDIWDEEIKIQEKKDDEFKEYQRANLSARDFRDWEIDKMIQMEEYFENECGFCGTNSSEYMRYSPKNYALHYFKTIRPKK